MTATTFRDRADGGVPRTTAEIARTIAEEGFIVGEARTVTRTILDSFDGRLHHAGLRLEAQHGLGLGLVVTEADSVGASMPIEQLPSFAADLPIGPFRDRIASALEVRALRPMVTFTDVVRNGVLRDDDGKTVVAVAIHEPITVCGNSVPSLVEVVQLPGHGKQARRVRSSLKELGFVQAPSALVDQVFTAAGVDPVGCQSSPSVPLDADMPAVEGFRAVFQNLATAVTNNWEGTLDDVDTEFLHELRVAIRRTRSVLGHGKDVVPAAVRRHFRDEFAWLAQMTGPTRDLDVYILEWDRYAGHLSLDHGAHLRPVLDHLRRHRMATFGQLVTALRSERARVVLDSWRATLLEPGMGGPAADKADKPVHRIVARRIRAAHDTIIINGRMIDDESPAEALHELRKDAKKLRYAIECFGGLLPHAERKDFVRQLKGLQDNLGEHQDAEVHSAHLRSVAHELAAADAGPDTLMALGQLTEHLEFEKLAARAEFARRFGTYDSRETRDLLASMLESIDRS